jgi:predicted ATPase
MRRPDVRLPSIGWEGVVTIAVSTPRRRFPLVEELPRHPFDWRASLDAEAQVASPRTRRDSWKEEDPSKGSDAAEISFGPFRLLPGRRLLLEGGTPVQLGSRALEILIALVERPGELVAKKELISRVWPNTHVAEDNLKSQVAALRRALGDGRDGRRYLETNPRQGYRFVAPVEAENEAVPSRPRPAASTYEHNLPSRITPLIGRSDVVASIADQLTRERLLTVVGPAGIGKTSVALAAAERLIDACADGVWRIDLASITDPRLLPTAMASALRLASRSDDSASDLIAAVKDLRMLLVLDNCEHLIEPAAALAIAILRGSRDIRILATSREPLQVEGERVRRLSALESPPESIRLDAAEALRFPAVQLFVERATATMDEFELSDRDAPGAAGICRKLDGVPLAIEFAAARVYTFGVRGLAARLEDQIPLLGGCHRLALPRHRTISAALDWSYNLLSQEERTVFRRLAILVGAFTLESAIAVVAGTDKSPLKIASIVESLVMKSLVTASVGDGEVRFRLFEATRAYALNKLPECGESDALEPTGRRSFPSNGTLPRGKSPRPMFPRSATN